MPLYSTLDALNSLDYFGRTAVYSQVLEVAAGVHATFIDAGHILGSASIFLELEEQSHSTSVLFSGDLGNAGRLLLRSPPTPPHAENVVMETTYGDRLHKPLGPSVDEFFDAITETFKRGGNVIIPTFALERAQELLYFLSQGIAQGRITKSTQVYLDSPMAISATEIFRRIYTINGFSAHADEAELLTWQKQTRAKRTFLVHGEEVTMRQFAAHLSDTFVEMPGPNQAFEL